MDDMTERYSQLPKEKAERLLDLLGSQSREAFEAVADLDNRLTNTNFLTNGGGAVAALAFLGEHPDAGALKISLCLFAIGVVATGLELRSLMKYWGELCSDANRRRRGFANESLTVEEVAVVPAELGNRHKFINHWAGVVSQWTFALGFLVGAWGFL